MSKMFTNLNDQHKINYYSETHTHIMFGGCKVTSWVSPRVLTPSHSNSTALLGWSCQDIGHTFHSKAAGYPIIMYSSNYSCHKL